YHRRAPEIGTPGIAAHKTANATGSSVGLLYVRAYHACENHQSVIASAEKILETKPNCADAD
ncbi:MAG: hypothetical protein AAEC10_02525, partial [Rhodospirillales bacterium]